MKKMYYWLAAGLLVAGCGGPSIDPETYLNDRITQAENVDNAVAKHLSYRTLSGYTRNNEKWNVQAGYVDGKAAVVKMSAADGRQAKWWIYTDSATGKANFFKEETADKSGKGVRNMFGYKDTSLIVAKAGPNQYQPAGPGDFRMKAAEVNKLLQEVLTAVEADRADLPKAANDARKQNAQFFAAGLKPVWTLVINPSQSQITYASGDGTDTKKFGYNAPDQGPLGESIYDLKSMDDKMKVIITSKWCTDGAGKVYPYTVVIQYKDKSYSGYGVLLQ
jgi:uncharacterized membrane protein